MSQPTPQFDAGTPEAEAAAYRQRIEDLMPDKYSAWTAQAATIHLAEVIRVLGIEALVLLHERWRP